MKKDTWGGKPKKRGAKAPWGGKPKRGRTKDKFLSPKFGKPPKRQPKSGWGMDGLEKKKDAAPRKSGRNFLARWIKRPSQLTLRNYYNRVGQGGQPLTMQQDLLIKDLQAKFGQDVEGLKDLARAVTGKPLSPASQNTVRRWVEDRKQRAAQAFGELGELVDAFLSLFRRPSSPE
ncbi:MAG: hypothetical protein IT317_13655 [Anaerolineales bacterium]|nr:hypothetical protein [Anaerolineales bacterium]